MSETNKKEGERKRSGGEGRADEGEEEDKMA